MKKLISLIVIGLMPFVGVNAKNEGKNYLPEQGDVAIGLNMRAVLQHAGLIFGNSVDEVGTIGGEPVNTGYSSELLPNVSFMGKYMLSDSWALRANVGLLFGTDFDKVYVQDDKMVMLNPFDESKLVDQRNTTRNGMSLLFGTEYRTSGTRVQGIFGIGAILGFVSNKTAYYYANAVTTINQRPSIASGWEGYDAYGYRTLERRSENSLFGGVSGHAGVEWFVAPKVALGAEVNLCLYYVKGGQEYRDSEGYNPSTKQVELRTDLISPGNDRLHFGTENLGGSFYMAFYF